MTWMHAYAIFENWDVTPTLDFLDKDAVGLNGLCSLSWCLHKYYHVLYVIARLSFCYNLVNCPAVICYPSYECFIYLRDSTSEPMAPGPSFLHCLQPHLLVFHHYYSIVHFSLFYLFHHTINRLFSARPEILTTFPPLGAKYFGWVCAGPRLLKIKRQRSSTFTLLLISKSYWFDNPRFVKRGKTATSYNSAFAWGTTQLINIYHNMVIISQR